MTKTIRVCPITSKIVQQALFAKGFKWELRGQKVSHISEEYLCFNYQDSYDKNHICHNYKIYRDYQEVTLLDILRKKTLADVDPFVWVDWDSKVNPGYKVSRNDNNLVFVSVPKGQSYVSFCKPHEFLVKD